MKVALKLSIEGMHCGACVRRVTTALQGVSGVQLGAVEIGSAQMEFSPELTSAEAVAAVVNGIGFQARIEK
jgi:copper chaperone CopZ